MGEPAVGRIGYVLQGFGARDEDPDRPRRQVRCNNCRSWYDATYESCSQCGHDRPGFNKWIRTAQLNDNLHGQVREQQKPLRERKEYKRVFRAARKQVEKHGPQAFLRP